MVSVGRQGWATYCPPFPNPCNWQVFRPEAAPRRKRDPHRSRDSGTWGFWGLGGSARLSQLRAWRGSTADRWQQARGSGFAERGVRWRRPRKRRGPGI